MKKLLMAMAILAVGVTAFGEEKASAPVKVRAELVKQNIVISDINGRPILLDFEKISTTQKTDKNAFVDFKVEATGTTANFTGITLELGKSNAATTPDTVTLTNIDASLNSKNTMIANLKLDKYDGTVDKGLTQGGVIHTGRINGTIKADQWGSDAANTGVYEGQTELKVTVAGA